MPCQGPSREEEELNKKFLEKLKDPIFLEERAKEIAISTYDWENGGKQRYKEELEIQEKLNKKKKKERLKKLIKSGDLEKIAFDSFMAVFLCKAMKLLESNNLLRFTYTDMEWWYNEHKYRDNNLNKSSLSKIELYKKLDSINKSYKVN